MRSFGFVVAKSCKLRGFNTFLSVLTAFCFLSHDLAFADSTIPGWHETPTEAHPYFAKGKTIAGKIHLGNDLIDRGFAKKNFKFTGNDVLYVIARKNKTPGSPPVAVVRIDELASKSFPVDFRIGPQDLMIKENAFVGPFHLKVKLSRHGDASTVTGDLIGYSSSSEIKMGSENVSIELSEVAGSDGSLSASKPSKHTGKMAAKSLIAAGSGSEGGSAAPVKVAKANTKSEQITGRVNVSPEMKKKLAKMKFKFKSTDVLFIVAKDAGSPGMRPSAVARVGGLAGKEFPISFTLSGANMMMGGPAGFKGPFLLKAKISRQGGVMTQKGDLFSEYSTSKKIKVGSKDVVVSLTAVK